MRHRVLDAVRKARAPLKLHGVVEIDELFFDLSFKGNHYGNFVLSRKMHRRGPLSNQRGHSLHKVCVISASARNGDAVMTVSNPGNASKADVKDAFSGLVQPGSTLCSDYEDLAHEEQLTFGRVRGIFHIQNPNGLHASLRGFLRPFRGISAKHLPNYPAWHAAMGGSVVDADEQLRQTRSDCMAYGHKLWGAKIAGPGGGTDHLDASKWSSEPRVINASLIRRKPKHPKRQASEIDRETLNSLKKINT